MADPDESVRVERLLARIQEGEKEASDELAGLVHGELHGLARRFMADQRKGHTLQPTALVNEAWLKLAAGAVPQRRAQFLRVAAATMRSILVDHARRRGTDKRGGAGQRVALHDVLERGVDDDGAALLALHDVLDRLAALNPDAAQVAEMRLFGGMENAEVASVLGISPRSVDRLWQSARKRLRTPTRGARSPARASPPVGCGSSSGPRVAGGKRPGRPWPGRPAPG